MNSSHLSLQRYISQSGHCSRRKAGDFIVQGKVELDGCICHNPWQEVLPGQRVKVGGVGVYKPKRMLYLALHKPPGYLTSNSDPHGRPCAIDLIQPIYTERLFHVGRLDKNSSGLIFFTNDGNFAQAVQHPSHSIEKEYTVKTRKAIPEFVMEHWERGIQIEGVRYRLRHYQRRGQREVSLVLTEGLNREIRRVFEHFHIPLKRVHRLRIGRVKLRGLASGEFRLLKPYEINALQEENTEGQDFSAKEEVRKEILGKKMPRDPKRKQIGGYSGDRHSVRREDYRKPGGHEQRKNSGAVRQRGLYNTPSQSYQSSEPRMAKRTGKPYAKKYRESENQQVAASFDKRYRNDKGLPKGLQRKEAPRRGQQYGKYGERGHPGASPKNQEHQRSQDSSSQRSLQRMQNPAKAGRMQGFLQERPGTRGPRQDGLRNSAKNSLRNSPGKLAKNPRATPYDSRASHHRKNPNRSHTGHNAQDPRWDGMQRKAKKPGNFSRGPSSQRKKRRGLDSR